MLEDDRVVIAPMPMDMEATMIEAITKIAAV